MTGHGPKRSSVALETKYNCPLYASYPFSWLGHSQLVEEMTAGLEDTGTVPTISLPPYDFLAAKTWAATGYGGWEARPQKLVGEKRMGWKPLQDGHPSRAIKVWLPYEQALGELYRGFCEKEETHPAPPEKSPLDRSSCHSYCESLKLKRIKETLGSSI